MATRNQYRQDGPAVSYITASAPRAGAGIVPFKSFDADADAKVEIVSLHASQCVVKLDATETAKGDARPGHQ
jgi:hypothetical protein